MLAVFHTINTLFHSVFPFLGLSNLSQDVYSLTNGFSWPLALLLIEKHLFDKHVSKT
jgi:hypothetical protein